VCGTGDAYISLPSIDFPRWMDDGSFRLLSGRREHGSHVFRSIGLTALWFQESSLLLVNLILGPLPDLHRQAKKQPAIDTVAVIPSARPWIDKPALSLRLPEGGWTFSRENTRSSLTSGQGPSIH
jgi:hypothetical protein